MEAKELVLYQVCIDRAGEWPFDGTGFNYATVDDALMQLWKSRRLHPHAYLATVTYQRCDEQPLTGLSQAGCFAVGESTTLQ